jgi:hypothetical protein
MKMKIHELAKELNSKATDILKKATELGLPEKSISSVLSEESEQILRNEFVPEVLTGEFVTPIAFVRQNGKNAEGTVLYEVVEAEVCSNGTLVVKKVTKMPNRTRAFHELGYKTGLLEIKV